MIDNFTPRTQQVLSLARKEADRFNHSFVGTEHLLLGLMALGQGVSISVLGKLGLNLENIRAEVEKQVGRGPDQNVIGNIPYTPSVKKVLALAAKNAKALNHTYVGTEHILLGILDDNDGVAARVLKKFGVDAGKTRAEILWELGSPHDHSFHANAVSKQTGEEKIIFSTKAQKALALSHQEARRFKHNFVGTEHILLGIICLNEGTGFKVLQVMGVNLEAVRSTIEKSIGCGPDQPMIGNIPYTPRVKKVLELAAKEAKILHHTYVGTGHLLLGLLSEGDGVAARVLKQLNITAEQTRIEILKEFDPNFGH